MSSSLETISEKIGKQQVVTIESCTGGLLGAALTSRPGSSAHYHHGYVTYSNDAKIDLGVPEATIQTYGAVSAETALAMAKAGRSTLPTCAFTIAVTGIAGPDTSEHKPVGLVYIAINDEAREFRFQGDRDAIRAQSVSAALDWLASLL